MNIPPYVVISIIFLLILAVVGFVVVREHRQHEAEANTVRCLFNNPPDPWSC